MKYALKLGYKAFLKGEVPIGAIIVKKNIIIGTGYNKIISNNNSCSHAEIIAINKACKNNKKKFLYNCSLYVTVEPCIMCTAAILLNRISKVFYGTSNKTIGGLGGKINILLINGIYKKIKIYKNIYKNRCYNLINNFFKKIRKNN